MFFVARQLIFSDLIQLKNVGVSQLKNDKTHTSSVRQFYYSDEVNDRWSSISKNLVYETLIIASQLYCFTKQKKNNQN